MARAKRDVMKALADARPEALDPERLAGSPRQQRDLEQIISAAITPARPRSVRRWLPVGAVGAVAAVAAGIVLFAPTQPSFPDVNRVLVDAANKLVEPGPEGTYWETKTRHSSTWPVAAGDRRFALVIEEEREVSLGRKPESKSRAVSGLNAVTRPRTLADEQAWRAAGTPASAQLLSDVGVREGAVALGQRPPAIKPLPWLSGREDHAGLPKDADGLRRHLTERYREEAGAGTVSDAWLVDRARELITSPVAKETRAAAYEVIAGTAGVRSLGERADPLGRKGNAIALPTRRDDALGLVEQQLIIDPGTGLPLASQEVLVVPGASAASVGLAAGDIVRSETLLGLGWTDQQRDIPGAIGPR
ncbi:CU044_5270 family protein [Allokutzneria sp. NRRL B-24872]|uniref:CU044_5270 family protein n=1 Tax=Allokutzneria sp. NRRL B-24872 TaxID=1137961 RepID=UPI000A369415|nr:CU044_5270 family protein [Allokutzneria sp. NRRL B-24872]